MENNFYIIVAITNATTDISFNKMFREGPEVSLTDHLRITNHSGLMWFASFLYSKPTIGSLSLPFFGIVPGSTGIGLEKGH